jgi:hypothetical protein
MATGDQSGTWGDTTNTNLGTLLEQAITGYVAIAKVGTGDYTLSNTDYAANENRNALIEFTGTPGGAFNVVVPLAEKLWVFKNSTNGAMTVKGATGTTTTVATGTSRWLYCDGTNVLDALTGTLATQAASSVAITGGTVTGLTNLTLASGAATPATNNAAALGTSSLQWADLFLANGGVINFDNGDVTITEGTNTLAFAGASSGYSFDAVVTPAANDGAALGTGTVSWADLFLASGGVLNFANGNWVATHTSGILTVGTGDLRVTTAGTDTASVVTVGGTQTLTGKTLTDPAIVGTILEDVYTIVDGAAFEIDPSNGSVQLVTLGANRTPLATNFAAGESITLMINDGTAYTITWTSVGVTWVGGSAPTLATTGYTVIELWKVSSTIYGALVGSVA